MNSSVTPSPAFLAESRVPELLACYIIPIPLELITTGLRLYIKLRPGSKDRLAFDDYLMVFATVVAAGVCVSGLVYGPPYGFGHHIEAVPEKDLEVFMLGDYVFSHFYNWAIVLTKLSVLALYYRIFVPRTFRLIVIATAVFVFLWLCTMEIVLGLQCRPIQAFWDASVKGHCNNLVAFSYFTNITNLLSDIWIFTLPLPIILKLQVSRNRKIGLCFLFSIGLATCTISAVRLSVVVAQGSPDFTWAGVPLGILSGFEPLGGILCANLPILYRYIAKAFNTLRSAGRTHPSQGAHLSSSQRPTNKGSSSSKWIQLPHGNSNSGGIYTTSTVYATKSMEDDTTELRPLDNNKIVVERQFDQEIYHGTHYQTSSEDLEGTK